MKFYISLAAAFLSTGCAYSIHQYAATDFTGMKQGNRVVGEGSKHYILVKTDNEFVEKAYASLLSKCPTGRIAGITSHYRTDLSFLSFTERLILEGTCITE